MFAVKCRECLKPTKKLYILEKSGVQKHDVCEECKEALEKDGYKTVAESGTY